MADPLQEEIDFLLESIQKAIPNTRRKHQAFIEAAEVFLAEAEADSNSRRVPALLQAAMKAYRPASIAHQTLGKNVDALENALQRWRKSASKDQAELVNDGFRLIRDLRTHMQNLSAEILAVQGAMDAIGKDL
jgi:hypothetical protein